MLLDVSINLLWIHGPFPNSKGRLFVAFQGSSPLLPYHSFHLVRLDVLVEVPSFDSIFVLPSANTNQSLVCIKRMETSYVAVRPCRSLISSITRSKILSLYSLVISGLCVFQSSAVYFLASTCLRTCGSMACNWACGCSCGWAGWSLGVA
jgi:hypothetical protein